MRVRSDNASLGIESATSSGPVVKRHLDYKYVLREHSFDLEEPRDDERRQLKPRARLRRSIVAVQGCIQAAPSRGISDQNLDAACLTVSTKQ